MALAKKGKRKIKLKGRPSLALAHRSPRRATPPAKEPTSDLVSAALEQEIRTRLKRVHKLAPRLLGPYLAAAYRAGRWLTQKRKADVDAAVSVFNKLKEAHVPGMRKHALMRLVIACTVRPHVRKKMKDKYGDVLSYASAQKVKPEDLGAFIKKHGGLNGCLAARAACLKKKARAEA